MGIADVFQVHRAFTYQSHQILNERKFLVFNNQHPEFYS